MRDNQEIQEELRNLPAHSLNKEQKQRILSKLSTGNGMVRKRPSYKPFIAIITSLALFSILVLYQLNWNNTLHQAELQPIELTAPEAKIFTLSGSNKEVIGIENQVALLNVFDHFVAEDTRRVAKLMIHYWGDPTTLIGKDYHVEAMNTYGEKITLAEGELYSPLHGEDAHTLTRFSPFPTEGEWQLSFYVEDQLHGEFTLDVLPSFPKTEHYTLIHSPEELSIGETVVLTIESTGEIKEHISVKLVDENGNVVEHGVFKQDSMNYNSATNASVYYFIGEIKFPNQGTWILVIDGEETKPFDIFVD
ncbi:hypothetical protein [Ornithinibacillus californiensis]|uniref:hypothetical protein n=1 Tax=Ornithinibacillus californiensis TaxID=161536 RepID=UPI00064DF3B3|nr:hypothetical protein [Ornithinibacillus californiensis]